MERNQTQPLDSEQAKARLRDAARRSSPLDYIANHPTQSILFAVAAGFFAGYLRIPRTLSISLAEKLLPFFVKQTFKSRRKARSRKN